MSYVSGTLVPLSTGRFVRLTVDSDFPGSIRFQLYDANMQGTFSGVVDAGWVRTMPINQGNSWVAQGGIQVVADNNGGFVVAYNTTTSGGSSGQGGSYASVKAYAGDSSVRAYATTTATINPNADMLAALDGNGVAFVTGSTLRLVDIYNGGSRVVAELGGPPTDLTAIPGGVIAGWSVAGQPYQTVVSNDGAVLVANEALAIKTGTANADVLAGTNGGDSLSGGFGADVLYGGPGYDVLSGGEGGDKFLVSLDGSVDRILDFNAGEGDLLLLLNAQGNIASGAGGLLTWNQQTDALTWDADSDAGLGAPVGVATLEGVETLLTRANFAAGFQPGGVRTIAVGGQVTEQVFDWGSAAFDTVTSVYTPAGQLKTYEVRYDTGAYSLKTNDVANTTTEWASVTAEYDRQGNLSAYTVVGDDGGRTLWLFDTDNSQPWSRVLQTFDPLGRLAVQAGKMDDGTAFERYIDTYDLKPWAYYIENFAASGARLNLTYYDANGGVMTV